MPKRDRRHSHNSLTGYVLAGASYSSGVVVSAFSNRTYGVGLERHYGAGNRYIIGMARHDVNTSASFNSTVNRYF